MPPEQRPQPPVLRSVDEPPVLVQHGRKRQPPCGHLKDLVAPPLGLLDFAAAVGIGREQRRLGLDPVQEAGDLAIGLYSLTVEAERRHRPQPVGQAKHAAGLAVDLAKPRRVSREPEEPHRRGMEAGWQLDAVVLDSLVLQEEHPRSTGV